MSRARSIEIYLKEGVEDDDQIYDVWSALRERGRPQAIFRQILKAGIRTLNDSGDLPRVAADVIDPEVIGTAPVVQVARPQRRIPDPRTVTAAVSEGTASVPRKAPLKQEPKADNKADIEEPAVTPKTAEKQAKPADKHEDIKADIPPDEPAPEEAPIVSDNASGGSGKSKFSNLM